MLFGSKKKIEVEAALFEQLEQIVENEGYSSVEELTAHLLGQAIEARSDAPSPKEKAELEAQLRGLGYLK